MPSDTLTAALEWLEQGYTLTKLHGITKYGHCTCGRSCGTRAGKHPTRKDPLGEHAVRTPEQAVAAFGSGLYNIGLVTGTPTGVVVLDVDTDHGKKGRESLERLAAVHGWDDLTATRRHRTGGGGEQYLFRYRGRALKTTLSVLGRDLDFKAGDGGAFIVLPPSRSGKGLYEVMSDDEIQPLPRWLRDLCEPQDAGPVENRVVAVDAHVFRPAPDAATAIRWDWYAEQVVAKELERLDGLQGQASGWTMGIFRAACAIFEIANSPWNTLTVRELEGRIRKHLPRVTDGSGWDCWVQVEAARRRTAGRGRPTP